jgi:capsular polysaccharide biosynthesis protein
MEYQINFLKIFDAMLARVKETIVIGILVLLVGFLVIDGSGADLYSANSTIYAASNASYQESVTGMNIMRDYVDVIRSRKVAERASAFLSGEVPPELIMGMVSASFQAESKIITITATSADPELAIAVANAVADSFIREMISVTAAESVKVLDSAYRARMVYNAGMEAMQTRVILAAGAAFGFLCVIAALAAFDSRVSSENEVTLAGRIELLGVIPDKKIS